MKIFFVYLIVVVSILVCSCQRQAKPETNFFRDFNLGEIVKKMNVPELKPKMGVGGIGTSNGEITERSGQHYLEYNIVEEAGERFNEAIFFDALKSEVEKRIYESGIPTHGGGSEFKSFYYTYTENGNRGSLAVVGARLEGNKYMLWYFIRESAGEEKQE